ncbi:hypothetical protein GW626_01695 [Peribacillus muralis]|uniref:hypothetical protein n=1 Tax=Peribacillus muralis TaxID=264697 RepID=UPI001F4DEC9F|nr:hypothetical protein [Peribacillus muralis]MCK1994949.1 hypothetical protein [Peribacillus muralis]MCK2015505.1 hypothetical protein [Peribacillus muralis]
MDYHQKLLLTIALDKDHEQYTFFYFILDNDLSKDSKVIFDILHALEDKKEGSYEKGKYEAVIESLIGDHP